MVDCNHGNKSTALLSSNVVSKLLHGLLILFRPLVLIYRDVDLLYVRATSSYSSLPSFLCLLSANDFPEPFALPVLDKCPRMPCQPSSCRPSDAMDIGQCTCGYIVIYYVFQVRDIQATSGKVCGDEDTGLARRKGL